MTPGRQTVRWNRRPTVPVIACIPLSTLFAFLVPAMAGGQETNLASAAFWKVTRDPVRNITVVSPDLGWNAQVMQWIQTAFMQAEKLTGLTASKGAWHEVRIGVRMPANTETNEAAAAAISSATNTAPIVSSETWEGRSFVQRLGILDPDHLDRELADEFVCRLFLSASVVEARLAMVTGTAGSTGIASNAAPVPVWFYRGLAQNLEPVRRARNSEQVYRAWQEGKQAPVHSILAGEEQDPTRERAGMLFAWLLSLPTGAETVRAAVERLAAGHDITPDWVAGRFREPESAFDLEERWDRWILQQRRIVYVPGRTTVPVLETLKAELLFHPGQNGVPFSTNLNEVVTMADLIRRRKEPWIKEACRSKMMSLQIVAIGRGDAVARVVALYGEFLRGVAGVRRESTLRELLKKAEAALMGLDEMERVPSSGSAPTGS